MHEKTSQNLYSEFGFFDGSKLKNHQCVLKVVIQSIKDSKINWENFFSNGGVNPVAYSVWANVFSGIDLSFMSVRPIQMWAQFILTGLWLCFVKCSSTDEI